MSVYSPTRIGYVHIPKTGGTSIAKWIEKNTSGSNRLLKHESASMLQEEYPNINYFFTLVRNPWSRVVSFYRDVTHKNFEKAITEVDMEYYQKKNGTTLPQQIEIFKKIAEELSFEEFINQYIDIPTNRWYNLSTPQVKWLDVPMDMIIKMENLNDEFIKIQKIFRNNTPLLHLNKHQHPIDEHYTSFYNEQLKKKIADIYAEDIETFKYKFEE
jgi:hypothetical protein